VRALLENSEVIASPGQPFSLGLQVSNTDEVIDSVSVSVSGLPGAVVKTVPGELALFPGASGTTVVTVELPVGFPAGRHEAKVEARARVSADEAASCDFVLDVEPVSRASLSVSPLTRKGQRKSRFSLLVDNLGNTSLDITLDASDPERALRLQCIPDRLSLAPASSAEVILAVQGPRHIFGGERARQVTVEGTATPVSYAPASPGEAPVLEQSTAVPLETRCTYVQKPRVPRGVVTALVLAAIVGLWAGIFTFAINAVLGQQTLTKSAPLSFFAPLTPTSRAALAARVAGAGGAAGSAAAAGFQPKDVAPLGVGGVIAGTVTSPDEPGGVGSITVQAFLQGEKTGEPISAATGPNGTYQIIGLFPGTYKVAFGGPGFTTVWYPQVSSEAAAQPVNVAAQTTVGQINAVIKGDPASISGQVMTGETPSPPVKVQALVDGVPAGAAATTNSAGRYSLTNLPSPATFTLAFSSPGFLQSDTQVDVEGGQAVAANTVQLSAGLGEIEGTVTGGKGPLGGVNIKATANGNTFTSATPTTGPVGRFDLPRLPTPATYLLNFSKPGFGTRNVAVNLGPGQLLSNLQVAMVGGTGSISGTVRSAGGKPLGDVTVSVGGSAKTASTKTLTAGDIGAFTVSGLPTPGTYAVTFSLPGYSSQTIGVTLSSNGLATGVNVTLSSALGQIVGAVKDAATGLALPGVTVNITSGSQPQQTVTAATPPGGYTLAQLPPGTYSVTYSLSGYTSQTALINLAAGQTVTQEIALQPASTNSASTNSASTNSSSTGANLNTTGPNTNGPNTNGPNTNGPNTNGPNTNGPVLVP
jgi:Carboxypeptidase regulatory-like domain